MNKRIRREFEKVNRWVPSVVRACFSMLLFGTVMIYIYNDGEFTSFFAGVVSLVIIYFFFEFVFIWDRLDKLERGKK